MSIANKIVVGLVGLTVMAVIFSAMLPIMGEVTSAEDTFRNDGWFRLSKIDDTAPEVTIVWDHTNPSVLTVNSVDIEMSQTGDIPFSIVADGDWALRYFYDPDGVGSGIDCIGTSFNAEFSASTSDNTDMTISLNSGVATCTISGDDTPKTKSYTECFHISTDGPYTLKKPTSKAYVLDDSEIFGVGRTGWNKGAYNSYVDGSIADDFTITILNRAFTVSDVNIVYSEVSAYEDLYLFDKITYVVSNTNEPPDTHDTTYSQVVVPYEVTAEKVIHPDGPTTAILNMLPIIVGAGLLLGAIAFMIVTRK